MYTILCIFPPFPSVDTYHSIGVDTYQGPRSLLPPCNTPSTSLHPYRPFLLYGNGFLFIVEDDFPFDYIWATSNRFPSNKWDDKWDLCYLSDLRALVWLTLCCQTLIILSYSAPLTFAWQHRDIIRSSLARPRPEWSTLIGPETSR